MIERKKIIKSDKKLLVIIITLIILYNIFWVIWRYLLNSGIIQEGLAYGLIIISCALLGLPLFCCICLYGLYMLNFMEFKISEKKFCNKFQDEEVVFYKEGIIYITENYIVSAPSTYTLLAVPNEGGFIELNNLVGIDVDEEALYEDELSRRIVLYGMDKENKKYEILKFKKKEVDLLREIVDEIKRAKPQIPVNNTTMQWKIDKFIKK